MGLSPTSRMRMPPTMNAATTAIRGNRSSRASLGISGTGYPQITQIALNNLRNLWLDLMAAGHQQTNLFKCRRFRIDFARDASFVNDQQTIGKTRHFFELRRDEQDRTPRITQADELPVNKLDCADVHAARRL